MDMVGEILSRSHSYGIDAVVAGNVADALPGEKAEAVRELVDEWTAFDFDIEDAREMLAVGYIRIDDEDIDKADINSDGDVVIWLQWDKAIPCDDVFQDTDGPTYIGFASHGWPWIDGAICQDGSVGYFDENGCVYRPAGYLADDDYDKLIDFIGNCDFGNVRKVEVKRVVNA